MRATCLVVAVLQLLMTFTLTKAIHVDETFTTFYADTAYKYLVMAYNNTCYLWHLTGADAEHIGFSAGQVEMEKRLIQAVEQNLVSVSPVTLPDPQHISVVIYTACQHFPTYRVYVR